MITFRVSRRVEEGYGLIESGIRERIRVQDFTITVRFRVSRTTRIACRLRLGTIGLKREVE